MCEIAIHAMVLCLCDAVALPVKCLCGGRNDNLENTGCKVQWHWIQSGETAGSAHAHRGYVIILSLGRLDQQDRHVSISM